MQLSDLVNQVTGFNAISSGEKIRLFAWWLHTHRTLATFRTGDIRNCYEQLHLPVPNIAMYLIRMTETKPPKALRKGDSYNLTRDARADLDATYGTHPSIQAVSKLLADLPTRVPNMAERVFLSEALDCYRVRAYRACIVMTWNLAFNHLLNWILEDRARLDSFNAAISRKFPKRGGVIITKYDDFADEFTEFEIIEVCNNAQTVNSNIIKILKEKLVKRNMAAHPSSVVMVQSQADDVATDLVNNVVLALN